MRRSVIEHVEEHNAIKHKWHLQSPATTNKQKYGLTLCPLMAQGYMNSIRTDCKLHPLSEDSFPENHIPHMVCSLFLFYNAFDRRKVSST